MNGGGDLVKFFHITNIYFSKLTSSNNHQQNTITISHFRNIKSNFPTRNQTLHFALFSNQNFLASNKSISSTSKYSFQGNHSLWNFFYHSFLVNCIIACCCFSNFLIIFMWTRSTLTTLLNYWSAMLWKIQIGNHIQGKSTAIVYTTV